MASQAAALKYANNLDYGTAVPTGVAYPEPRVKPSAIPVAQPRPSQDVRAKTAAAKKVYGISLFAITGALFAAVLMVFVILAHVSFNEVTSETVRLQKKLAELTEQERKLEIAYESAFDINAIELYATGVLGMTKPDAGQMSVIKSVPQDKAEVIAAEKEESTLRGLGSFLSSLLEYFK